MSTIVKYKNNILTTVENETKTIKTANKWMEDNLVLEKTDSENPAVYQDENGYIVVAEDGDRVSTKSLTVNANGTYTAPTGFAYNNIFVRVPVSNVTKKIIDKSITNVNTTDFPNLTTIGQASFQECKSLETVNLPNVTSIGINAFYDCSNLTTINLPNITQLNQYEFWNCSSLTNINIPKVTGLNLTYTFRYCGFTNIAIPSFNGTINSNAFRNCPNLKRVDCCATKINNANNFDSSVLDTLILRGNSICTLAGTNSFNNTPFASGGTGGTLYVPSALISSYQSATNWSTILGYENNQILPIEGSIYETQYADGTPISS